MEGQLRVTARVYRENAGIDWVLFFALINVILLSGCVQYFNIFVLALVNVALQLVLLRRINFKLSKKLKIAMLILLLYFIYSVAITSSPGDALYIAFRFHDIITALLVLNYTIIRKPNFIKTLAAVFIFFIVHGYVNWLIVNSAFGLFSTVPSIKSYQFIFFFGMQEQYMGIHRSQGLFWEPGVYQFYLNVALHFFLFYYRRLIWVGLAFVGVILTLSTTGTVIAGIQLVYFLFFNSQRGAIAKVIIIAMFLPVILLYCSFVSTVVTDKLSGGRSGSFIARSFDTQTGINVALTNPLGIGFNPDTYQEYARTNAFGIDAGLNVDRGQTNGLLILAYSTGLIWAPIILFFMYRQRIFPSHRGLFFFVLAGSLMTEPLFYSPFVFLFVLSGMIKFLPLSCNEVRVYKRKYFAKNDETLYVTNREKT